MTSSTTKRHDLSGGLIHLTRERGGYELGDEFLEPPPVRSTPPFEVLKEILLSGVLKGSGNSGYVKGNRKAVCLSEMPISAVPHFAATPGELVTKKRYRFYGLALSKKTVFQYGGRPVIYLPDGEATWIPTEERWRHVRFEFGSVDHTHEREWRVPGDLDLTKMLGIYAIVWSANEAKEIMSLKSPVQDLLRGALPMQHLSLFI